MPGKLPGETFINNIDDIKELSDAEKANNNNEEKYFVEPCEIYKNVFTILGDLQKSMCNVCLICISENERIELPNRYQCAI